MVAIRLANAIPIRYFLRKQASVSYVVPSIESDFDLNTLHELITPSAYISNLPISVLITKTKSLDLPQDSFLVVSNGATKDVTSTLAEKVNSRY